MSIDKNNITNTKDMKYLKPNDIQLLMEKKRVFFNDIIQKTMLSVQKNKLYDILGVNDVVTCMNTLNKIQEKIKKLPGTIDANNTETTINQLQTINNDLSGILKSYGTESLEDVLMICFGSNHFTIYTEEETNKYELLKRYFHPTSYKVLSREKKEDAEIIDKMENLHCGYLFQSMKQFYYKVYGMSLYICDTNLKKNLLVYGVVDDIMVHMLDNKYINNKMKNIREQLPKDSHFQNDTFHRYLISLTLKDLLVNSYADIYKKYVGILSQHKLCKQKTLNQIVREFVAADMYGKRNMLIQFLINSEMYENKYMAYLLYDLLSNDANGIVETHEQTIIFDSFTWPIKEYFRDAMKKTAQYTNDLSNFDTNKIPMEQQICLMKANDNVKEKAMVKLKEIKSKTEDSGTKARQYLDGLMKIPFSIYKREPILCVMDEIQGFFKEWIHNTAFSLDIKKKIGFVEKNNYTFVEIQQWLYKWKQLFQIGVKEWNASSLKKHLLSGDKTTLIKNLSFLNEYIVIKKKEGVEKKKSITMIKNEIDILVKELFTAENKAVLKKVLSNVESSSTTSKKTLDIIVERIEEKIVFMNDSLNSIKTVLDEAVHGHEKAKTQMERIIGQWISGDQDGYCFGFEGPPGVGKTSLAKNGLSRCLLDENGESRPFAFIQIGGDSNGSTLHGHNYTYVGSTWGSIAQILMDNKCMNPIIFIDEVDKISRTEHGKEMIGILTHMLDSTQNDSFQDKYFNGIDLDLSKVLFILSYNDVDAIDRILLDRIHRVQFKNLSLEEKITIAQKHMLPDIYKKMGLQDMIQMSDETVAFIVETYTSEAGVRKLKEKLFEIVGQVNIEILKRSETNLLTLPIEITVNDVRNKYFKDKMEVVVKKVGKENKIGIVNGMWANSIGQGGTLPITTKWFPSGKFLDLKLTGLQEKVMQESMHVAETVAWELTDPMVKEKWIEKYDGGHKYGIHIHTGDGSVSKDGPSGGAAITTVIYSLLNDKKIKSDFAITGEIDLNGEVNQIGGVDLKILGSIKAGVTHFIYPESNQKDIDVFLEKYREKEVVKGIELYPVSRIEQVLELILE
jgi:ATP-dependent Lon protease